jgi:hypothetical protein
VSESGFASSPTRVCCFVVLLRQTSVINRFAKNKFSKDYQTTIGVDFALKRVRMGASELNVQLWDIAGQERFAGLSRVGREHTKLR